MSNDTFIREVNEEMRQDRIRALWTRFGFILAGLAIVIVLGTAAYVLWERHQASVANADGTAFIEATELASAGDTAGAIAALTTLAENGVEAYPHLARMRIASLQLAQGDTQTALAGFDAVAAASAAPQPLRDIAAIRAGYILVDTGTWDDVLQRVQRLTDDTNAMRAPAREALGLAAWKEGDLDEASIIFGEIVQDLSSPEGIAQRAVLMQELIDSQVPYAPAANASGAPVNDLNSEAPPVPSPAAGTPAGSDTAPIPAQPAAPATPSSGGATPSPAE